MSDYTPFELDVADQPAALHRVLGNDYPAKELVRLVRRPWKRVVLTGMGSSHFAALPTWSRLVEYGTPAWAIDSSLLADNLDLLTSDTLLIVTSLSGSCGEIVELLQRLDEKPRSVGARIGITAAGDNPLAKSADLYLPLYSGEEATINAKSYLNALAVHRRISAAFTGEDFSAVDQEISSAADAVATALRNLYLAEIGGRINRISSPRLAAVGRGDSGATALYASLITKEGARVAIEGYVGDQFRHGPFELAGPGLFAFLYGAAANDPDGSIARFARDLADTGSTVILIGDLEMPGIQTLSVSTGETLPALCAAAVVAQLIAIDIAEARGVIPGSFQYGNKVTTAL